MKIIVCLDDADGMLFNCRRQSRDRAVMADIEQELGGARLYITPFSQKLIADSTVRYTVSEDMISIAGEDDYCFVEDISVAPFLDRAEEIIIYRWNRRYPADLYFDCDLESSGFSLVSSLDFEGVSHEKITKQRFRK